MLVLDEQNASQPIPLESANDFIYLRFEWLRQNVAVVSSAHAAAAVGSRVFNVKGSDIQEATCLYRIDGTAATKSQQVEIGGQWMARSGNGDWLCILSSNAERAGLEQIGKMFNVSKGGTTGHCISLAKSKGQRRVEDLAVSSNGDWIGIAGNSPVLFVKLQGAYNPNFLEVDNDRIDEFAFDS